ncbi:MAG: hypothetical protein ABIT37_12175 [Luteolibacter sp.]
MKPTILSLIALFSTALHSLAGVAIDVDSFGKSLGGWTKRSNQSAEYPLSGSSYRTYKPEVSPTPDGGIFVSVRIDHVRGWLASDDHAILEITVNSKGMIASAQSNIAIQGQSITSDVILGSNEASKQIVSGPERAVQIGADLVSNLSAKMLRENIVEAGRVSFPAALRHNYNQLFQAVRLDGAPVTLTPPVVPATAPATTPPTTSAAPPATTPAGTTPSAAPPSTTPPSVPAAPEAPKATPAPVGKPAEPAPASAPLEIKAYGTPSSAELPVQK